MARLPWRWPRPSGAVYRTLSAGVGAAAHVSKPVDPERSLATARQVRAHRPRSRP
jgi:hypothetical protein